VFPIIVNGQQCNDQTNDKFFINVKECNSLELAIGYVESVLEIDMLYVGGHTKDHIKEALIWNIGDRIKIDDKSINDINQEKEAIQIDKIILPPQKTTRILANYLLFTSDIINDKLLIKLLFNRNADFNLPGGESEYEKWSRMNGGMVYKFHLDKKGCIVQISKYYEHNG